MIDGQNKEEKMEKMKQNSLMKLTYAVDLVFCIDATASMDHILDMVKDNALNFYDDFQRIMNRKRKIVSRLRIRVVAFRDYYYDGDQAMLQTKFFEFPRQMEEFERCIRSIVADGGGDDPEDGLEALAYAMKSDWNMDAQKRRHVIVVWSDASTHDLGFGKAYAGYPAKMPKDFCELTSWWGSKNNPGIMDQSSKRLLMFTPDEASWSTIAMNWDKAIQYVSEAGTGLVDKDYEQILNAIANSI